MDEFSVLSDQYIVAMPVSQSHDIAQEGPLRMRPDKIVIPLPPIPDIPSLMVDNLRKLDIMIWSATMHSKDLQQSSFRSHLPPFLQFHQNSPLNLLNLRKLIIDDRVDGATVVAMLQRDKVLG